MAASRFLSKYVLEKYKLPYVESDALVNRWRTDWMQFWQNQLHFAVWCATTGCGVDFNHHLKAEGMVWFNVHVSCLLPNKKNTQRNKCCITTRRKVGMLLTIVMIEQPYERICKEFGIDVNFDWRQKQSDNQGLGNLYNYWTNAKYPWIGGSR